MPVHVIFGGSVLAGQVLRGLFGAQPRQGGAGTRASVQTQKARQVAFTPPAGLTFARRPDQGARPAQRLIRPGRVKGDDVAGSGHVGPHSV